MIPKDCNLTVNEFIGGKSYRLCMCAYCVGQRNKAVLIKDLVDYLGFIIIAELMIIILLWRFH
jgi:hypothetical protein